MSDAWSRGDGNKLIPKEVLEQVERWRAPDVTDPRILARRRKEEEEEQPKGPQPPTVEEIEAIQRQAFDEGYAAGLEEGRMAGRAEYDARLAETQRARAAFEAKAVELNTLMEALIHPFEALDEQVERELAKLAILVARQVVRRELKLDPGQVVAAVREAAVALPVAARKVQLHLHPDDAVVVREALAVHEGENAWRIVEDPRITRGGCEVASEDSRIDATVEQRLNALIVAVLGDQRGEEEPS